MKTTAYHEKYLPVQPDLRNQFDASQDELLAQLYTLVASSSGLQSPSTEFHITQSEMFTMEEMGSNPILLRLLELLVLLKRPSQVLEIGTFIGIATMYLARVMPTSGRVVTIERFDKFADVAARNFAANRCSDRIELLRGDAFEELPKLDAKRKFDLVFLDGDKGRYDEYFDMIRPRLAPGAVLIVDDVFFHGDALNEPPKTDKGAGVKRFLARAREATEFRTLVLPIGNGVAVMLKVG